MTIRNMMRVLLAGALFLCTVQEAFAYDWNKCRSNLQTWDSNNVRFRPSSVSFPSGSAWRTSVEAMRTAWNTAPGTRFDFTYSYSSSGSYSSGDDRNSILITNNYNYGSGTLAVARRRHKWCVWPFWGGKLKEVDVLFNPAFTWVNSVNPSSPTNPWSPYNSTLVGIHELGHAFGLDHEDDEMATMNSVYPNSGTLGQHNDIVPHSDDVHGNRAGYGTLGSSRDLYGSTYYRTTAGNSRFIPAPTLMNRATPTSFRFSMGNRGTTNESSVGVNFYFSTDRNITSSDYFVGSAGFSMDQGSTTTRWVDITVDSSIPAGDYYFGWIVDPANNIGESDEGNNAVALMSRTTLTNHTPPNACFTMTSSTGSPPLTVSFNASCSSDPDGSIISYNWVMGDGTNRTGSSLTHTYWDYGYYTIYLTVQDNTGLIDTFAGGVNVFDCGGGGIPLTGEPEDKATHTRLPEMRCPAPL